MQNKHIIKLNSPLINKLLKETEAFIFYGRKTKVTRKAIIVFAKKEVQEIFSKIGIKIEYIVGFDDNENFFSVKHFVVKDGQKFFMFLLK